MVAPRYLRWCLLAGLGAGLSAWAVVYDLQPGVSARSVTQVLRPTAILSERVTINGQTGTLDVGYSDLPLDEALYQLRTLLQDYRHKTGQNGVLIEAPGDDGWLTRFYVFSVGEKKKTLVFALAIPPAARQQQGETFWPPEFPRPGNVVPGQVMRLDKRGVVFAAFTSADEPAATARQYDGVLRAGGWRGVSSDAGGGAYLSADERRLLVFGTAEGRTGTSGTIFLRPIAK